MIETISSIIFTKSTLLFIFNSPQEILLVLVVVFLLFGASRLPQLAKSLGQSKKAFQDGLREAEEEAKADEEKRLQLASNPNTPQISAIPANAPPVNAMSDEELAAELRRRSAVKQQQ